MSTRRKITEYCVRLLLLAAVVFGVSGCGKEVPTVKPSVSPEPIIKTLVYPEGSYDSADTAVVTKVDVAEGTVSFWNYTVSKQYTLSITDASVITDRYGTKKAFASMQPGDIVTVRFLRERKTVSSIEYPSDIWVDAEVRNFSFDETGMGMTIGQERYTLDPELLVFGEKGQIRLADVDACDVLTVRGRENTVYSIAVTQGHGYLRLTGDAYFVGGYLEIGNTVLRRITEDMVIAVPAGEHTVRVSQGGNVGEKDITIQAGEEITLDFSDAQIAETKSGKVTFRILPESAEPRIYVDNKEVGETGGGKSAELSYGVHQLLITADGYEPFVMYLKVGSSAYEFTHTLKAKNNPAGDETGEGTETQTGGDTTGDTGSETGSGEEQSGSETTGGQREKTAYVIISQPIDCELYVDGVYIGVTPALFKKEEGSHVVTFRRTGYQTRSYTITLDGTDEDAQYSFVELISID